MSSARGIVSSASKYSGKLSQDQRSPRPAPCRDVLHAFMSPISHACRSGFAGANPDAAVPMTTVVTPCQHEGVRYGSHVACPS